jgi:hypothetical protein
MGCWVTFSAQHAGKLRSGNLVPQLAKMLGQRHIKENPFRWRCLMTAENREWSVSDTAQRGVRYVKSNWLAIFSAFVIGLGLPLWRYFFVERPVVRVEITQVEMDTSNKSVKVHATQALKPVVDLLGSSPFGLDLLPDNISLDDLESIIATKKTGADDSTKNLEGAKKLIADLKNHPVSWRESSDTAYNLRKLVGFASVPTTPTTPITNKELPISKPVLDAWLSDLETLLKRQDDSVRETSTKVTAAETALAEYKATLNSTKARIRVDCAAGNAGGGGISLKPQALLRAYLGGDNFVDVRMHLAEYPQSGQLEAKSSRLLRVESDPLDTMSPKERDRIAAYFKNSPPAQLFLTDIEGRSYVSNIVPFGTGLYDDKVYDALTAAARRESERGLAQARLVSLFR